MGSLEAGYLHPAYADSLAEYGTPRSLPHSGGWVLERQVPESSYQDAMGCYPLFCCRDWAGLHQDLRENRSEWVSLALVTDPFGAYDPGNLRRCFNKVVIPYKEHFIIDLQQPLGGIAGKRHRKQGRRALRELEIEAFQSPVHLADEWYKLYCCLIEKHGIKGIRVFSRNAFAKQLSIPGTVLLWAKHRGVAVGATVYFIQGDVAYCHLAAASPIGYELGVFKAMDWYSICYFRDRLRWLDLGGGAGMKSDGLDGLSLYKSGWASDRRTAYFCGHIFRQDRYDEIVRARRLTPTDYFPSYRQGEFE